MTTPTETPSPAACPGCGGPTTFAGTIGTFCGNKGCDRVDDMRPAPSLTTEQARDFAKRFSVWGGHPETVDVDALTDGEREQLFAWVRARVVALRAGTPVMAGHRSEQAWLLSFIAQDLGLSLVDGEAIIAAAKGWPS